MESQKNKIQGFFITIGNAFLKFFRMIKRFFIKIGNCLRTFFQKIGKNISYALLALQKWFVTKKEANTVKRQNAQNHIEPEESQTNAAQKDENDSFEKNNASSNQAQDNAQKTDDASKKAAPKNSVAKKERLTAKEFFFNFFDILASLAFMLCIFTITKPILICGFLKYTNADINDTMTFLNKIGIYLFSAGDEAIEFIKRLTSIDISYIRNCLAVSFIALFILLKLIALLISFGTKKIISFLLSLLSIGTVLVVFDNFLAFLLLSYLAYFIFQLSCGATAKAILVKTILIICIALVAYPLLNLFFTPGVLDTTKQLRDLLKLNVKLL